MKKTTEYTNAAEAVNAFDMATNAAEAGKAMGKMFPELLRAFESKYTSGGDYTHELLELSKAVAYSVLKKCIDPQRKTAWKLETVSDSGHNPALVSVKKGIYTDFISLDDMRSQYNAAFAGKYNANGYYVSEVENAAARDTADALLRESLSDGIDVVNEAAAAILSEAAAHAGEGEWLESPYMVKRLSKKVYIKLEDSAKWEDVETSPIVEVYRMTRRHIAGSRAMQTDPRNGYTYIEDTTADPDCTQLETIYRRLDKYADLGGYTYDINGKPRYDGVYSADMETVMDYNEVMAALNLTDRQAKIVALRMRGYGFMAIGTYLGVSDVAIVNALKKVQKKAEKIGFTPGMWREMCRTNNE